MLVGRPRFRQRPLPALLALLLVCLPAPSLLAATTAQLSGRVTRADTGAPLPHVVITLVAWQDLPQCAVRPDRIAKSTADGSYTFTDVAPGCYNVVAYLHGYLGATYGAPNLQQAGKLLKLAAGQALDNINFRLQPAPAVSEISDGAFNVPFDVRRGLSFGPGRFSPDGRYFAFLLSANIEMNRLWQYDLQTSVLTPLGRDGVDLAWHGDTLYLATANPPRVEQVTSRGLQPVAHPPAAVEHVFQHDFTEEPAHDIQQNERFIVTAYVPCHGCGETVRVRRKNQKQSHDVAVGLSSGYVFDPRHSVVLYLHPGLSASVVAVDLNTAKTQEFQLPTPAPASLLDAFPDSSGYDIAFVSAGPCLPEEDDQGQNPWILPNNVQYRRSHYFPAHICFTRVPYQGPH